MTPTRSSAVSGEPRERSNYLLIVWISIGFVALILGGLLMVTSDKSASFGWFAYAPLSEETFVPSLSLYTLQEKIGMATGVIGLAILAFCGGWTFGRRRRHGRS